MSRLKLVLDPPGYFYAEEPGFHWYITGRKLYQVYLDRLANGEAHPYQMFCPDGSEWLLPWPLQWTPGWYADPRLGNYVCRMANWVFAGGIDNRYENEPTRQVLPGSLIQPGGAVVISYPANQWIYIPGVPQFTPIDNTNFASMALAADITLPQGLGVIAYTDVLPDLASGAIRQGDYTPYWQILCYPPPNDFFCFGFHGLAFVLYGDEIAVLRTATPGDNQNWELVKKYTSSSKPTPDGGRSIVSGASPSAPYTFRERTFTFVPCWNKLHIYQHDGQYQDAWEVPINDRPLDPFGEQPGCQDTVFREHTPFWVAAYPGQVLGWQTQVVGYHDAILNPVGAAPKEMFSLGEPYKPTVAPLTAAWSQIFYEVGSSAAFEYLAYGFRHSAENGCTMEAYLLDSAGALWASNGSNYHGGLHIRLKPSTNTYLPAMLRHFEAKWPVKLTPRANQQAILLDTEFKDLRVETSWREPGGKRLSAAVTARAAAIIKDDLGKRDNYPVHLVRWDDGGDPDPDEILVRAWVANSDNETVRTESDENPSEVLSQRLDARGLMVRGEGEPLYLPQLLDPRGNGRITYVYAFKEVVQQIGFNPEDPDFVEIDQDWFIDGNQPPCEIVCLPGTWAFQPGESELKVDSPWAMDWGETYVQYLQRIAEQWRGWLVFETMKHIRLAPDHVTSGAVGDSQVTIYATKAEAAAAGYPGQYHTGLQESIRPPAANCVRVTGKDGNKDRPEALIYIDRDRRSLTDITYPHFLGEPKVLSAKPRMAMSRSAMMVLTRVLLLRKCRRVFVGTVNVPIAPWEFQPVPVDVGVPVTIAGKGKGVVAHMEYSPDKMPGPDHRKAYRTRLVVERLPEVQGS